MLWNSLIKNDINVRSGILHKLSISLVIFGSIFFSIILLFSAFAVASESERTISTPFTSQNLDNAISESLGDEEIMDNDMNPDHPSSDFKENLVSDNFTTPTVNNNSIGKNTSNDLLLLDNTTQDTLTNTSTFSHLEDPVDGISILYPTNWTKIEYPKGGMNYGINNRIIVNFLSPIVNESSSLNNITSTLNKWRTYVSIQFVDTNYTNSLLSQDGTTVDPSVLGGHPAYMLISSVKENIFLDEEATKYETLDIKKMQVWTTINNVTYMFTYEAESTEFENNLPVVKDMLKSFKKLG